MQTLCFILASIFFSIFILLGVKMLTQINRTASRIITIEQLKDIKTLRETQLAYFTIAGLSALLFYFFAIFTCTPKL